jgi:type IV secretory pathway TraG/TraD family ATPase VirD4
VLALFVAVPKDRARRMIWKHGRRLRGPELVTTAEFNTKLGRSKGLMSYLPDGVMFINEEMSWSDKLFHKNASQWARIPREREAMHFLIVGDSGTGKSAAIRQMLSQIWERGESAIVYDPAMEYLPQFYNEARGDVILNPMDARCPFWSPGDEVPHEAEALTLAASLFPDQGRENRFFVEAPRKIFAHLLNLKPTPQQLTYWMSNAEEIDKRVEGTELAAMIDRHAANQRSGVLGSLNMVADAFKLLPKESETKRRWNTVEWAQERKGWVFLTSKPTMRERMRPLMSLWLDLLVLRLMNEESAKRKTWFVLDELASLQRLPQLTTAVTENRKSNNPMVLGFQGKSQVEALYGHVAEAMLSQPATKIFLKTSEPYASEWISKAIGEIEVERFRESRTRGRFPRNTENEQRDITREPLVMASEVGGLDPLHGYLKHGNLVLRMRFPYLELANNAEKFVERKMTTAVVKPTAQPAPVEVREREPVMQRKPPQTVQKKQEQKPAEVNEQHPYFE